MNVWIVGDFDLGHASVKRGNQVGAPGFQGLNIACTRDYPVEMPGEHRQPITSKETDICHKIVTQFYATYCCGHKFGHLWCNKGCGHPLAFALCKQKQHLFAV